MDLTLKRRVLYGAAGGCLSIAAAAVVWSLGSLPDPQSAARPSAAAADESAATETPGDAAGGDRAGAELALPLQQTLHDPPPPPPKAKPQPKPAVVRRSTPPPPPVRLDWTLLGTIIEPQRRVAILADASGKTDIRAVGEEVDLAPAGVLVQQVDSAAVTLERRGTRSTLRLKQDFSPGGGQPPRGERQPRGGRGRNR